MPPVRRYIRLTAHTTLQTLIFLDDPADLNTWLLHPSRPALPRIVDALRDMILPKLYEERSRELKGGSKKAAKSAVKDTVTGSDFEVNVFLKDGGTRHVVMAKHRSFLPKEEIRSNSTKLLGDGASHGDDETVPNLLVEEDDENVITLENIPLQNDDVMETAGLQEDEIAQDPATGSKNRRSDRTTGRQKSITNVGTSSLGNENTMGQIDLSTSTTSTSRKRKEAADKSPTEAISSKRNRSKKQTGPIEIESDDSLFSDGEMSRPESPTKEDKKAFVTRYDGFTIYGKVLYLIVKRTGRAGSTASRGQGKAATGEGIMDEWMLMSQAVREEAD